jgi:CDP-paratose 2-epimerase
MGSPDHCEESMKILVTGSSGLIGSEAVRYFDAQGHTVVGVDNNMRREFFGPAGDTTWCRDQLLAETRHFKQHSIDIRDRDRIADLFRSERFNAVVHCAAQPSHDRARDFPILDFEVNALGSVILLEANRQFSAEAPFILMSTNKVYGDAPNEVPLVESETRFDYADPKYRDGISETCRIDASMHSVFGASKVAADVMVQEYGRYFGMPTCCLRGGCLTGPAHSGVELHGFLSYLVKCNLAGSPYRVYGYKGKQVRDNIHSLDVVRFMEAFLARPRSAAVYNIGGGKRNAISILEAFVKVEELSGRPMNWAYEDAHRSGDHICYYSDLSRMRRDYPDWDITKSLDNIFAELLGGWRARLADVA